LEEIAIYARFSQWFPLPEPLPCSVPFKIKSLSGGKGQLNSFLEKKYKLISCDRVVPGTKQKLTNMIKTVETIIIKGKNPRKLNFLFIINTIMLIIDKANKSGIAKIEYKYRKIVTPIKQNISMKKTPKSKIPQIIKIIIACLYSLKFIVLPLLNTIFCRTDRCSFPLYI
jgi:hypothetical protein